MHFAVYTNQSNCTERNSERGTHIMKLPQGYFLLSESDILELLGGNLTAAQELFLKEKTEQGENFYDKIKPHHETKVITRVLKHTPSIDLTEARSGRISVRTPDSCKLKITDLILSDDEFARNVSGLGSAHSSAEQDFSLDSLIAQVADSAVPCVRAELNKFTSASDVLDYVLELPSSALKFQRVDVTANPSTTYGHALIVFTVYSEIRIALATYAEGSSVWLGNFLEDQGLHNTVEITQDNVSKITEQLFRLKALSE